MNPPSGLDLISWDELKQLWPDSEDGRLCARLVQRYAFSLLVNSSDGAKCTADLAQSEAGANKAFSKIVKDAALLVTKGPDKQPSKGLPVLHRFRNQENTDTK